MADTIVVLVSSDDDEDSQTPRETASPNICKKISKRASSQATKRKFPIEDEAQRSGSPVLPLIAKVETLATPTATPPLQLLASPPRGSASAKEPDKSLETGIPKKRAKLTTLVKDSDDAWQQLRQNRLASTTSLNSSSQPSTPNPSETVVGTADHITTPEIDLTGTTPTRPAASKEMKVDKSDTETTDSKEKRQPLEERPPLEKEYEELISECRKADPSSDMEKLIETKLLRYYYSVHPDFVKSRGFRKNVRNVVERIRAEPELVYYNLKTVVDELNIRRKSKDVIVTNEESSTSTGGNVTLNKHTEQQIKKLNKALYILKKRIAHLEETEVDWDDEDSAYLQVERFKKRACQIYDKICDLTGESKNANRLVKKPIQFNETSYPSFNKTLQAYINRTKEFPDYYDVLRMLEHCNNQYDLKLASFEVKRIAQDAFIKVGKVLQSRRKTDLYETVAHFTANSPDPATTDPALLAKLTENQKTRTKISDVIEKYARAQDDPEMAAELINSAEKKSTENIEENSQSGSKKICTLSDESDENDEEEDENLDVQVETLAKDNSTDIESDVESDVEMNGGDSKQKTIPIENQVETNDLKKCETKEKGQLNPKTNDVKLTENNNIMRTKTIDSNLTETAVNLTEETNGIAQNTTSETEKDNIETVITALPEKSKSVVVTTSASTKKPCSEILTKSVKTTSASKLASKLASKSASNPAKHRTIAEIVISDEE